MEARVKWVEGLSFLGESASGHQVMMDGNAGDKAPSPMEMVLMAAGGCSAIDVVSILQKGRYDVTNCEVKLTSQRREEAPRYFVKIHLHFIVAGNELTEKGVERAVQLSAEKYCSVALMLEKTVEVTHSFEIKS
ncbi:MULTISPECIES: OsmC family protein [Providencia]|uniref:OsmC family protein n=1 Tax=Providencia TaxID=586 RepID=UPI001BD6C5B1|nr:OsmC family protein [Providencia rettgeri]ELR5070341.1 OsmC family protein [Providencia rettgeri]ELR5222980.1 OsmC family protein [Providencia rettgeri]MDX7323604.1 OsmC family protein [Providencia rettgeri]UPS63274.1 OsmC family protein [Providencia rettgeri]